MEAKMDEKLKPMVSTMQSMQGHIKEIQKTAGDHESRIEKLEAASIR